MSVESKTETWLPSRRSEDFEAAWDEFLREHASLVLQVVHLFERDPDRIDDCFIFVCEHLKHNNLRKLRRFDPNGTASFSTWLRAVVRNLCLDWRRKRFGRPRLYRSIARLPELEREIFRSIHQRGFTENEAFHTLKALYPGLTRIQLAEGLVRVEKALSSRQEWLLATSRPKLESLAGSPQKGRESAPKREIATGDPDPEQQVSHRERLANLKRALERLSSQQRLLLRLRFEQELTIDQIARLTQSGSPLRTQRALQKAVESLQEAMKDRTGGSVSVKDS